MNCLAATAISSEPRRSRQPRFIVTSAGEWSTCPAWLFVHRGRVRDDRFFCSGAYLFCACQSIIFVSVAITSTSICGRPSILPPQDGRSSCSIHALASTGKAGFAAVGSVGDGVGGVTRRRQVCGTCPAMLIILPATQNAAASGSTIPPESSTLRVGLIYGAVRFFIGMGVRRSHRVSTCSLDIHQKTRWGEPQERCNFCSPTNTLTQLLTIRVLYRSRNVVWMCGLAVGRLCDPPGKPLPHSM